MVKNLLEKERRHLLRRKLSLKRKQPKRDLLRSKLKLKLLEKEQKPRIEKDGSEVNLRDLLKSLNQRKHLSINFKLTGTLNIHQMIQKLILKLPKKKENNSLK